MAILIIVMQSTMPTFNSCTKCAGSPGMIHGRTPNWHPHNLNVALLRKLTWVIVVLGLFLTCYPWVFAQPSLVEVRSTGAEIKCLYCMIGFLTTGQVPREVFSFLTSHQGPYSNVIPYEE